MCRSITNRGGQERNGQWFNDILGHGFTSLLIAPFMWVASIHGIGKCFQYLWVSIRLLCFTSDKCQRQAKQGPAAIRSRRRCLSNWSFVAFTQRNLAQEENREQTQQHDDEAQEEDAGDGC